MKKHQSRRQLSFSMIEICQMNCNECQIEIEDLIEIFQSNRDIADKYNAALLSCIKFPEHGLIASLEYFKTENDSDLKTAWIALCRYASVPNLANINLIISLIKSDNSFLSKANLIKKSSILVNIHHAEMLRSFFLECLSDVAYSDYREYLGEAEQDISERIEIQSWLAER